MATETQDVRLPVKKLPDGRNTSEKFDVGRNFANKLWNASRFAIANLASIAAEDIDEKSWSIPDRWILSRLMRTIQDSDAALAAYRFDLYAKACYDFFWRDLCDWYIEAVKPQLIGDKSDTPAAEHSRAVLVQVLDRILRLLHPFMPFLTEELWQRLPHEGPSLAAASFPVWRREEEDPEAEREMTLLMAVVTKIRNIRAETNIDPARRVELLVKTDLASSRKLLESQAPLVQTLGNVSQFRLVEEISPALLAARGVVAGIELAIPLADALNLADERRRLTREIEKVERELEATRRKLENKSFVGRAPANVVDRVQSVHRELLERRAKLSETLSGLDPPEASPTA